MSDKLEPTRSPETYHLYCKKRFLGAKDHDLPNGETLTIPNSTADLDTDEFNEYMEQVEALAAEHGVYLDE